MVKLVVGQTYLMRAPWTRQVVAAKVLGIRKRWFGLTAVVEWNVKVYDFGKYQYSYPQVKTVMARRLFDGKG